MKVLGPDIVTSNGAQPQRQAPDLGVILTLTAKVTGTGAVTGTVQIEGSNNGIDWYTVGAAVALSGTAPQTGSAVRVQFSYAMYRHNITNITGTGATVEAATCISS